MEGESSFLSSDEAGCFNELSLSRFVEWSRAFGLEESELHVDEGVRPLLVGDPLVAGDLATEEFAPWFRGMIPVVRASRGLCAFKDVRCQQEVLYPLKSKLKGVGNGHRAAKLYLEVRDSKAFPPKAIVEWEELNSVNPYEFVLADPFGEGEVACSWCDSARGGRVCSVNIGPSPMNGVKTMFAYSFACKCPYVKAATLQRRPLLCPWPRGLSLDEAATWLEEAAEENRLRGLNFMLSFTAKVQSFSRADRGGRPAVQAYPVPPMPIGLAVSGYQAYVKRRVIDAFKDMGLVVPDLPRGKIELSAEVFGEFMSAMDKFMQKRHLSTSTRLMVKDEVTVALTIWPEEHDRKLNEFKGRGVLSIPSSCTQVALAVYDKPMSAVIASMFSQYNFMPVTDRVAKRWPECLSSDRSFRAEPQVDRSYFPSFDWSWPFICGPWCDALTLGGAYEYFVNTCAFTKCIRIDGKRWDKWMTEEVHKSDDAVVASCAGGKVTTTTSAVQSQLANRTVIDTTLGVKTTSPTVMVSGVQKTTRQNTLKWILEVYMSLRTCADDMTFDAFLARAERQTDPEVNRLLADFKSVVGRRLDWSKRIVAFVGGDDLTLLVRESPRLGLTAEAFLTFFRLWVAMVHIPIEADVVHVKKFSFFSSFMMPELDAASEIVYRSVPLAFRTLVRLGCLADLPDGVTHQWITAVFQAKVNSLRYLVRSVPVVGPFVEKLWEKLSAKVSSMSKAQWERFAASYGVFGGVRRPNEEIVGLVKSAFMKSSQEQHGLRRQWAREATLDLDSLRTFGEWFYPVVAQLASLSPKYDMEELNYDVLLADWDSITLGDIILSTATADKLFSRARALQNSKWVSMPRLGHLPPLVNRECVWAYETFASFYSTKSNPLSVADVMDFEDELLSWDLEDPRGSWPRWVCAFAEAEAAHCFNPAGLVDLD